MHMNHKVAIMDVDTSKQDENAIIVSIIYDPARMPYGILDGEFIDDLKFFKWFRHRIVPEHRRGMQPILERIGAENEIEAAFMVNSLSLSDCYWTMEKGHDLNWNDINFFENNFSNSVGNLMFGVEQKDIDICSPDIMTDGCLVKAWRIKNGKRYLIKQGKAPYFQEPVNEAFVSALLKRICRIDFTEYSLTKILGNYCSVCENFLKPGQDFVPAFWVFDYEIRPKDVGPYNHLINMCKKLQIPDAEKNIQEMIAIDFLISNSDRHLGNFGFIRDAETLKYIKCAPLFDNGTSLWNQDETQRILKSIEVSKPFSSLHDEQIMLVDDYGWLDAEEFDNIEDLFESYLTKTGVNKERTDLLVGKFKERKNLFKNRLNKEINWGDYFVADMPKELSFREKKEKAVDIQEEKNVKTMHKKKEEDYER